jgi:cytochrome bd ubiquinol oxidase subunit II
MDLNIIWFLLITVVFAGYAILDGFDLGVGALHLFIKDDTERRLNMNAIGPVWDGNEVWLLTGGGALFAAFPVVYASVFSGFYLALMLLLFALIARAVSFEFRGKVDSPSWRKVWDYSFSLGSILPAVLFGVAFGNILRGIPLDTNGYYTGSFFDLLNPYAVLIGLLSLSMFVMHGAIYMTMKLDGEARERRIKIASTFWIITLVLYMFATFATFFVSSFLFIGTLKNGLTWIFLILLFGSILYIPVALKGKKFLPAMISSSLMIASMFTIAAISLFPRLVPASNDLALSLTIYNASSTPLTLKTMLIIALIGMPIVIGYTIFIYRVFKGKVELNKESY